jgi:HK97 family phage prohead protease
MTLHTREFCFKAETVEETGVFTGYASVFDVLDSYNEIVSRGAFLDSLAEHKAKGTMPAMLWQHRSAEPMGVYTEMDEDSIGLRVRGQIAMKTQRGAEAYELLKMGAISGMSIGFTPREDSYDKLTGITTLKKVKLWENSLVTFPANDAARVQGVKAVDGIITLRDAEDYLREAGISKGQALAFLSKIKSIARSESAADDAMLRIREALINSPLNKISH